MSVTIEAVQEILAKYPTLNDGGYGLPRGLGVTDDDIPALRDHLLSEDGREAIGRMVAWIKENMAPAKYTNTKRSSYGLKHIAERDGAGYASNGEFIVAALLCGYRMGHEGYNPSFNMSEAQVKRVERRQPA